MTNAGSDSPIRTARFAGQSVCCNGFVRKASSDSNQLILECVGSHPVATSSQEMQVVAVGVDVLGISITPSL